MSLQKNPSNTAKPKIFEIKQHFYLESARRLSQLPPNHPCSQIHGHSFKVILTLRGPLDPVIGWLRDYHEVLNIARKNVIQLLDHKLLNEVPGLENPTTELLCVWIFDHLKNEIPELHQISIQETATTECTYPILD